MDMICREIDDDLKKERLIKFHMPIITSVNQLTEVLGISREDEKRFFAALNGEESFYRRYKIPKKTGGYRYIDNLFDLKLKQIQTAIDKGILRRYKPVKNCHSYIAKHSIVTNAKSHLGAKVLLKFDIANFFPSINYYRIVALFKFFGYGTNVSKYLAMFCVNSRKELPQGGITSPMISNLVCIKLDKSIESYCEKMNLTYTRYADDITISSKDKLNYFSCNGIKDSIHYFIFSNGFTPNYDKFHWFVYGQKMIVTGIRINNGIVSPNKKIINELDNAIYYIKKYGIDGHLNYIQGIDKRFLNHNKDMYILHLYGAINFIKMVNKEKGEKYKSLLNEALRGNETNG